MKEGGELYIRGKLNYLRLRLFEKNLNASKHPTLVFFTLTDRDSTIPSNIIHTWYVVANPVRGLLDRKRSQEQHRHKAPTRSLKQKHKQNEKRQKERNNNTKHMPEKYRIRAHDRESLV